MFNSDEHLSIFATSLKNNIFSICGQGIKLGKLREALTLTASDKTVNQLVPELKKISLSTSPTVGFKEVLDAVPGYFKFSPQFQSASSVLIPIISTEYMTKPDSDYGLGIQITFNAFQENDLFINLCAYQDSEDPCDFFGEDVSSDNFALKSMIDHLLQHNLFGRDSLHDREDISTYINKEVHKCIIATTSQLAIKKGLYPNVDIDRFDDDSDVYDIQACHYYQLSNI
jgi:hypothetical protein